MHPYKVHSEEQFVQSARLFRHLFVYLFIMFVLSVMKFVIEEADLDVLHCSWQMM